MLEPEMHRQEIEYSMNVSSNSGNEKNLFFSFKKDFQFGWLGQQRCWYFQDGFHIDVQLIALSVIAYH